VSYPYNLPNVVACELPLKRVFDDIVARKRLDRIVVELGPGRKSTGHESEIWIGLDPSADYHCDIYYDLEFGIPLPDESVDLIKSNQFLEHISRDSFIYFMNETWRVLKNGGAAEHCVPHFLSPWAFGDPTHRNWFSEKSFDYFCLRGGEPFVDRFSDYGIRTRFVLDNMVVRRGLDISVRLVKNVESSR